MPSECGARNRSCSSIRADKGRGKAKPKEVLLDLDTTARVAGVPEFGIYQPARIGGSAGAHAAMPGMHCQTSVSLHGGPAGYAGRPARSEPGTRRYFANRDFNFRQMVVALIRARQDSVERSPVQCRKLITKRFRLSRRFFLKGLTATQAPGDGWLTAADLNVQLEREPPTRPRSRQRPLPRAAIPKRFVLWFNGNGITERYWIPSRTGPDYDISPCLTPIARLKDDVLVLERP